MSNLNKKWSELSGEESKAAKEKYGSRSGWQEAKSRAQTRTNETQTQQPADKPAELTNLCMSLHVEQVRAYLSVSLGQMADQ